MKIPGKKNKAKILYLSYDGLTDPLGQSQILPYLTGLSDKGHDITIISFEKRLKYQKFKTEIQHVCTSHHLAWLPMEYHKFPVVLSTLYNLFRLKRKVKNLHAEDALSIIHCRSYLTSLVGLWAKKRWGVKFIFDMRGFWADERVEGALWPLGNPLFKMIYHYFKDKEKQFISGSDHIVCLTENASTEIRSWNLGSTPITIIPTCVDLALFKPGGTEAEKTAFRKKLSFDPDDFILVYVGSWGTWYLTKEIIDFFSVLKSEHEKSKLLILTPDEPDLGNYEFTSSVVIKSVSRREVPGFLNIADAAVCFIKPGFSKKASSATKMAEGWAMNLPVVTNGGWGDIDKLKDQGMPLLITATPAEYHAVAMYLKDRRERPDGRQWIIGKFDLDSGIRRYDLIYRSLAPELEG